MTAPYRRQNSERLADHYPWHWTFTAIPALLLLSIVSGIALDRASLWVCLGPLLSLPTLLVFFVWSIEFRTELHRDGSLLRLLHRGTETCVHLDEVASFSRKGAEDHLTLHIQLSTGENLNFEQRKIGNCFGALEGCLQEHLGVPSAEPLQVRLASEEQPAKSDAPELVDAQASPPQSTSSEVP